MYYSGLGVEKDVARGMALYRRAADAGSATALTNIGFAYETGEGEMQDYAQALAHYRRAAAGGDSIAFNNIANFYDKGLGIEPDGTQAAEWMEKALRAGAGFSRDQMRDNSDNWSLPFRKALQRRLRDQLIYTGPIDGGFGPRTQEAIDKIYRVRVD